MARYHRKRHLQKTLETATIWPTVGTAGTGRIDRYWTHNRSVGSSILPRPTSTGSHALNHHIRAGPVRGLAPPRRPRGWRGGIGAGEDCDVPRPVYVHETVDIIGQGQYAYMEHVRGEPTNRMPGMTSLQGTFFVLGFAGGRWPQVVNIWDCGEDGWEGWRRNLDRLNLKRRSAFYGDWWDEASQWRSGGYDRVCAGVPGSPTTAEIAERGIRGSLFVNEVLTVRAGRQLEFLAEVVQRRVPVFSDHGVVATGLWEVTTNATEVVMVWATTVDDWVRMRRSLDSARGLDDGEPDNRLLDCQEMMADHVTSGDTQLMTPLPGTVYGPAGWEDADLGDWLVEDPDGGNSPGGMTPAG